MRVSSQLIVVRHASQGVHTWHTHGYLHRNIRPSNLRRTEAGHAIILDSDNAVYMWDWLAGSSNGNHYHVSGSCDCAEVDWSPAAELYSIGVTLREVQGHMCPTFADVEAVA